MSKVLIIDDDSQLCQLVGEFLRRNGYDVAAASDGNGGLTAARKDTPDLILCDLEMPGMNGQEMVSTLRRDDLLGEIPVIFLSGCTERGQIRRSMDLGGDDFLTKPAPLSEILAAVNARLLRQQKHRQREQQRLKQTAEVFAGIIHDLDKTAAGIHWLATAAPAKDDQKKQLLEQMRHSLEARQPSAASSPAPLSSASSLLVKDANRRQFLKLSEVKALIAYGEYSNVYWSDKEQHMMFRKPLKQWQQELPADQFVRVHRQAIVNLAYLDYVEKDGEGKMLVHLREFKTILTVSQRATPAFNRCLKKFQANLPARS